MRRGQTAESRLDPAHGWTKLELMKAVSGGGAPEGEERHGTRRGGLSNKTFDLLRKAARINGPPHGGLNWVFGPEQVAAMVRTAEGGRFTERGKPIAEAWRALLAERGVFVEEREIKKRR
jgi:hypothetical protein